MHDKRDSLIGRDVKDLIPSRVIPPTNKEIRGHNKLGTAVKIIVPLGLVAILTASTETGRSIARHIGGYVGNALDNALYGQNVTSQTYTLVDYKIKPSETPDTLRDVIGKNPMVWDYVLIANGLDPNNLPVGKKIKVPVAINGGETIPELFAKFYASKK